MNSKSAVVSTASTRAASTSANRQCKGEEKEEKKGNKEKEEKEKTTKEKKLRGVSSRKLEGEEEEKRTKHDYGRAQGQQKNRQPKKTSACLFLQARRYGTRRACQRLVFSSFSFSSSSSIFPILATFQFFLFAVACIPVDEPSFLRVSSILCGRRNCLQWTNQRNPSSFSTQNVMTPPRRGLEVTVHSTGEIHSLSTSPARQCLSSCCPT